MTRGQALAEYAILIGIVTAAILGMQVYAKRGIQAGIKLATDQMSPFPDDRGGRQAQLAGNQYEAGDHIMEPGIAIGTMLDSRSKVGTHNRQSANVLTTLANRGGVTRTIAPGDQVTTTSGRLAKCRDGVVACLPNTAQYSAKVVDVREVNE